MDKQDWTTRASRRRLMRLPRGLQPFVNGVLLSLRLRKCLRSKQSNLSMKTKKTNKHKSIPEPTLRRLPWYLSHVKMEYASGQKQVSSTSIARGVGVESSLVAKDLSFVQLEGRTRVGYQAQTVISVLEEFLGFTQTHRAFLIGVGSLGGALLADRGLRQFGLEIVAGFDVDPTIVGTNIGEIPIYDMQELSERMQAEQVQIAILTVPIRHAQSVADQLAETGFRAIWNFTPVRIRVPEQVVVQNTSMYAHLALIFTRIKERERSNVINSRKPRRSARKTTDS